LARLFELVTGEFRKESCLQKTNRHGFVPDPDAELAEACKNGNLAAYEQLFATHGARMKSIALNILGSAPDAEDAVQEAFIKIYCNVGHFKGESAFKTWIYKILVNACYDFARKRRSQKALTGELEGNSSISFTATFNHPLKMTLERSLSKLGEPMKTVFLLFEVEGFKHREIAQILSIKEGTSKSLLFDAKKELQRLLWKSEPSLRLVNASQL
jgi:RNA polymerase sigma-70 factor, ECF subfamily